MLRIGTSGFSFPDWKGKVYPANIQDRDMLGYYERGLGFNTLEINFTYYQVPSAKTIEGMVKKTSPEFKFSVKCHKEMTHEIWTDESRTLIKDNKSVFDSFLEGIKPLVQSGKILCVLAQFPVFFLNRKENKEYILLCHDRLAGMPLIIEFRNSGWLREDILKFLRDHGLGFCIVDEPKLPRLVKFVPEVTSDIAYLRFHGRNKNWFNVPASERYNYLYSDEELREFVPEVKRLAGIARETCAFFNNCHAGAAAINAMRMKEVMAE
jgi:uncharacterized protein YecE (DUF72 family)